MTPYQRIAIYQRLDHDRDLAEKSLPCSTYTACAGIRNPTHKLCPGCPMKIETTKVFVPQTATPSRRPTRTLDLQASRDRCQCGRSKSKVANLCKWCARPKAR